MYSTEEDSKKMAEILNIKDKKPRKKKQNEIFVKTKKPINYLRKRKMLNKKKKKYKSTY